jgi:hypothetical protein
MFVLSLTRISEKLENAWMKDDGFWTSSSNKYMCIIKSFNDAK